MLRRGICDADHESFRASVRSLPREMRPAFCGHGLLGLQIPEQYAGSAAGDFRYSAVLGEELAKASMSCSSGHGIHADIVSSRPGRVGGAAAPCGTSGNMDER